jgi:CubicO group peptidase (beta-lactamase class C family)
MPATSRILVLAAAIAALPAARTRAQSPQPPASTDLAAITDRVFAQWNSTHSPGCAVGIAREGKPLLQRAYGMADLAGARALTPSTILESGSVAKQFTATAVLLLVQDGRLSLEDDARKYIPELPVYPRTITVRHLLTHTSGLREWSNLVAWQGWPRGTRAHTQDDVFELITRQKALNYPVGDHYSYTNSGFLLLRTIVERVSGMPFARFTAERIFRPLGMHDTQWRDDHTRVVPGLAQAYTRRADGWHLDMPYDDVIAAGGLLTTVADWLRWNDALARKTLGAAWADSMTRRMKLTDGTEIQYAMGLVVSRYRGLRQIAHSGSTAGYSTYLARFPDQGELSIAVMCNAAGAPATQYTYAIVDAMMPGLPRDPAPDTASLRAEDVPRLAGVYRDTRTNTAFALDASGGALRRGSTPVRATADGLLLVGGTRMRVERAADGAVRALRQATADGDSLTFLRVADAPWQPTPADLAPLEGRYRSDEIGASYDVRVRDGRLTLTLRPGVVERLTPTHRDAFAGNGGSVWFTRDARGRVTAMHFGSSRAWDFVSTRVN